MKILLIAMADSIHTARWVEQIADQGWEIHLFPSVVTYKVHPKLRNVTVYRPDGRKLVLGSTPRSTEIVQSSIGGAVSRIGILTKIRRLVYPLFKDFLITLAGLWTAKKISKIVRKIQPDIIHSLEFQHAGYLTLEVKKHLKGKLPTWIATNWGSDLFLFGRLREHEEKVRKVLSECDYYSCECQRDVTLAREFGFQGTILPVFPNAGGFDFNKVGQLRQSGKVSDRKKIMLKGYQGWAGRGLVGLRALEKCADLLEDYEVFIYSAVYEVQIAVQLVRKSTGIKITVLDPGYPHEELLKLHGESRVSMGLSISDGISTSFLEALVMGSFPIQSFTACASEWIEDGKTGFLVHPDDSDTVEKALRIALTNDDLVNRAAELNYHTALERLDQSSLKTKVINLYNRVGNPGFGQG